jgi:aspartate kinase
MKILVQKFGGTSVASEEVRIAAATHIEAALAAGYQVVVVVSAMGRRGDPYATDTLLSLIDESDRVSKRDLDVLMTCGEAISAVVFAGMLRRRGHQVTVLNGQQAGIITNDEFGSARILEIKTDRVIDELRAGRIVVVMGFQGGTANGDATTLGRGGSDTSATALGVALNAEYVDIFTDVEGIMTADPRIVDNARRLHSMTYTEICNLAYQGAKVIHPRAVEIAMQRNIPIRVRSTLSNDEGTLVSSQAALVEPETLSDRLITGVTQTPHITQIILEGDGVGRLNVFAAMGESGISTDFISVSPDRISYTVSHADTPKALRRLEDMGLVAKTVEDCVKVAVVGAGIAGMPGVMARIFKALADENIDILQSADSHTTIWCLVRGEQMQPAVRALHRAFNLDDGSVNSISISKE